MENTSVKHEYVYLIACKGVGYKGYTYEKDTAKRYVKHRKDHIYKKVKNSPKLESVLGLNDEIVSYDKDVLLTLSEEEYFIESLGQLCSDLSHCAPRILDAIKYIKFSKEEKDSIDELVLFIENYIKLMELETNCDDTELSVFNIVDNTEAIRYFIKNNLDA